MALRALAFLGASVGVLLPFELPYLQVHRVGGVVDGRNGRLLAPLVNGRSLFAPASHDDSRLAPSAEGGTGLAAAYTLEGGDGARAATPADSVQVKVTVTNTGAALWLSKSRCKERDVALQWRWLGADGREIAAETREVHIHHHVYPGQRYEFHEALAPPVDPGRYVLELAL